MEKTLYTLVVLFLTLNLIVGQNISLGALVTGPANSLSVIAQMTLDQGLPIEGVILEGWLPLTSQAPLDALGQQLGLAGWSEAQEKALTPETTLKLSFINKGKQTIMTFQLVSTDLAQAEGYYQIFQQFSAQAAQDTPVGVTILSEVNESLQPKACQYLTQDLTQNLSPELLSTTWETNYQSMVLYTDHITHAQSVAGQKVNLNITYITGREQTKIYIGSPIIYQQY